MKTMSMLLLLLLTASTLVGCRQEDPLPAGDPDSLSYLALGDSYTIGESVAEDERWPVQLAAAMRQEGADIADPEIVARTGWTTRNLLDAMDARDLQPSYDLVSILIGVNNHYQGRSLDEYRTEYETVLQRAIALAGDKPERVFVVSIPDYGFTSFGASNQAQISPEIDAFNNACREITERYGVVWYNITEISRDGLERNDYVAPDGLHPSGTQYRDWVAAILERVLDLI